jgi:hypothetical protein
MGSIFVNVQVEEHEALPDGCSMRFRAQRERGPVRLIAYEAESGASGRWRVEGEAADGSPVGATAYEVDDSSAGTSMLIVGGAHGLRLTLDSTGETAAESYLLLGLDCIVE